ncbi:TPA: DUF4751 family protein [Citrobacter werkmanii]
MNILSKHQLGIKYQNYMFINTMISNPAIKTVSKYILYKTWDGKLWNAEIIENGSAFFHWQGNDKSKGHKDTVINYLLNGQKWQATITDYVFFHCLEGNKDHGHYDNVIDYICSNDCVYQGSFAEYYSE